MVASQKNCIWSLKNAKCWKCRSFYCCFVDSFHQAFYKNFVILVFWKKYSAFVPFFIITDWKLGRYKESCISTWWGIIQDQDICRSSESFSKVTSQIKYKIWHNFGSRFDFDLWFFLKVIFLEGISVNKIKFHKIRCRSCSAVPL